jgi:hypothetical protein
MIDNLGTNSMRSCGQRFNFLKKDYGVVVSTSRAAKATATP